MGTKGGRPRNSMVGQRAEKERERACVCARLSMNPRATRVVEKLNASKLSGAPSIFWEKIGSLIKAEAAIFCASIDKKGFFSLSLCPYTHLTRNKINL